MHKTKESLQRPHNSGNEQINDAHEVAVEEAYEASNGAMSTDGVGTGYDADGPDATRREKAESNADGPASGEMTDPPSKLKSKKKHPKGVQRIANHSNHAAANSTKSI